MKDFEVGCQIKLINKEHQRKVKLFLHSIGYTWNSGDSLIELEAGDYYPFPRYLTINRNKRIIIGDKINSSTSIVHLIVMGNEQEEFE